MPNKFSHSVVLAHYSSIGLIDLPNDQYIAYLKTYSSRRPATTTSQNKSPSARHGTVTSSTGSFIKYRHADRDYPSPFSVTGPREHDHRTRRHVIAGSDDESGDEGVILHPKYESLIDSDLPGQKSMHRGGAQKGDVRKKLPSISTYAGQPSSDIGVITFPQRQEQLFPRINQEPLPKAPPSTINLDEFEASPGSSDKPMATKRVESSVSASVPNSIDPDAANVEQRKHSTRLTELQKTDSSGSTPSDHSKQMVHLTTALPPKTLPQTEQSIRSKAAHTSRTSRDATIDGDENAIESTFLDTLGSGPTSRAASVSSWQEMSTALRSSPPDADEKSITPQTRRSADHDIVNSEFWRGLEEILSASDPSEVFPSDMIGHKARNDSTASSAQRADQNMNGEPQRPTIAPAPRTSSRDVLTGPEHDPQNAVKEGNIDTAKEPARVLPTVQLIDTSPEKRGKTGFLRRLRGRSHGEKRS